MSLPLKKKRLIVKKSQDFKDNWADVLEVDDKKIIKIF